MSRMGALKIEGTPHPFSGGKPGIVCGVPAFAGQLYIANKIIPLQFAICILQF